MKEPLVSVIMTCYNRAPYIAEAIASVREQSFLDWELIVVDDCSTDGSRAIAEALAREDPRIRVYSNETNLGDYPNRNRAASLARGKYLKYVDSDDVIYPHCLAIMVHMMERHPEAAMLIMAWSETDPYYPFVLPPREAYRRCFVLGKRMSNSPLTCMYRHDRFREVGGFDVTPPALSRDYDLVLRLAREWPTIVAPTGWGLYRVHANQVSHTRGHGLNHRTPVAVLIQLRHLRHPCCPLPEHERLVSIGRTLRLGLRYAAGLALKKGCPLAALHLLGLMAPRGRDILALLKRGVRKTRPSVPNEVDWNDYPAGDAPETSRQMPSEVSCAVLVCGNGELSHWRATLQSLRHQWLCPQVTALLGVHQSALREPLAAEFPDVSVETGDADNAWQARNQWARAVKTELVKFAEPGVLFYPYALMLEAQALARYPEAQCVVAGQFGPVLHSAYLSAEEADRLDETPGYCAYRAAVSCASFRTTVFARIRFNPAAGQWAMYEGLKAATREGGLATAHGGLCSADHVSMHLRGKPARRQQAALA